MSYPVSYYYHPESDCLVEITNELTDVEAMELVGPLSPEEFSEILLILEGVTDKDEHPNS